MTKAILRHWAACGVSAASVCAGPGCSEHKHTHNKRRARAGVGVGRHRIMALWCLTMRLVFACQPANAYIKRSCCQRLMTRRALSCACTMSRQASTATRTCRGRSEHERPCQSPIQTDRQTDRHRRRRRSLAHAMSCRRPPSATWPDMVSSTAQMLCKIRMVPSSDFRAYEVWRW